MSAAIELIFRLSGNEEVRNEAKGLKSDVEQIGTAADSTSGGFSAFQAVSVGALGAVAIAAAAVGAAVIGIGVASFSVASDVNDAQNDLRASLGLTEEEAIALGETATDIWKNNFGEDIGDATDAIIDVREQMKLLSDNELQEATEDAFRLADTFELEIGESAQTANTLMKEFGLTSDQAFDFITKGYQEGLNSSDDFIDSINEYSNLFNDLGFDAEEMFGILDSGLEAGVLGTDKIADAFKEFGIKVTEGNDDARGALADLGLDLDQINASVAAGDETWADYFPNILTGLQSIEDPIERNRLQVALFGTMAEDLGQDFSQSLSLMTTSLEDMEGANDVLNAQYENLPAVIEGFKRRGLAALIPIGEVLLQIANEAMPLVEAGFAFFEETIVPIIETAAAVASEFFGEFIRGIEATGSPLLALGEALDNFIPEETMNQIWDFLIPINEMIVQIRDHLVARITELVERLGGWETIMKVVGGVILALLIPTLAQIVVAIAVVIGIVTAVVEIVHLLLDAWENDFLGIRTTTETVIAFIRDFITDVFTQIQAFWAEHGETILATAEEAWNAIQAAIESVLDFISEIWQAFQLAREGDWRGFGEKLREIWDDLWEGIKTAASKAWDAIITWLSGAILDFIDAFLTTDWGAVGTSIIQGIADGISAGVSFITDAATAAAQAALDAAKGFLGIDSPSKAFMEVGTNINEGMAIGLKNNNMVLDAVYATVNALIGTAPQGDSRQFNLYGSNFYGVSNMGNFLEQMENIR